MVDRPEIRQTEPKPEAPQSGGAQEAKAPEKRRSLRDLFYEEVPASEMKAKPRRRWPWIVLACVLALAIAAAALWLALGRRDQPVLQCARTGAELDNTQFQYYFWSQYYSLLSSYGDSIGNYLDVTKPLDEQMYDDTNTWQAYLQGLALSQATQTFQLAQAAQEADFQLPEQAAAQLDTLRQTVQQAAAADGHTTASGEGDVDAYLAASFGKDADFASYYQYMYATHLASAYADSLYSGTEYTDAQIETYYDARAEEYEMSYGVPKSNARLMDIRVIYFYPDDMGSEDDWADAQARAEAALDSWRQGPTDENFAALAQEKTESAVAPEGGLYTDVYPQSQTAALNTWLYGETRAAGDCEMVRDEDCWLLVYVKSVGDRPYWSLVAEADLRYEDYMAAMERLRADYAVTQYPEHIIIHEPTGLDEIVTTPVPEHVEAVG